MKIVQVIIAILACTCSSSHAQMRGGEWLDLVIESVDEQTAAELIAGRDAVEDLRDELSTLKDAEELDQEAFDAVLDEMQALRGELRDQLRELIESDEDLQAELRDSARNARAGFLSNASAMQNSNLLDEILAVATDEQAEALLANQDAMDALVANLQTAHEAGASFDEISDLVSEFRVLRDAQRDVVSEVIEANEDVLADVLDDANAARQAARENGQWGRGGGFGRRGGGSS
jgi:DNA repair exonuclease SbcCD ATPase subunit